MHWRILPRDWRILFGLLVTLFWFVFLGVYIQTNVGWSRFMDLPIAEMGNFLEGAFAFLAFLWLVIGLFIQQSVLAENNEELRRSNLNSEKQTQAIAGDRTQRAPGDFLQDRRKHPPPTRGDRRPAVYLQPGTRGRR